VVTFQKAAIDYELKRQRPDLALARLETIIARANRKETWLVLKGEILLAAGKSQEAQQAFLAALKAMDALPARMRMSPGMVQLRAKVEASLAAQHAGGDANKKSSGGR
jgi:predicted negative regulator of RcsB-dependent stress response